MIVERSEWFPRNLRARRELALHWNLIRTGSSARKVIEHGSNHGFWVLRAVVGSQFTMLCVCVPHGCSEPYNRTHVLLRQSAD